MVAGVLEVAGTLPAIAQAARLSTVEGVRNVQRNYPHEIPDPASLLTNLMWEDSFTDDKYIDYMLSHGFDPDRASLVRDAGWPRPGLADLLSGYVNRYGMRSPSGDFTTGYGWADTWHGKFIDAHLQFPSVSEAVTLLARGHIEVDAFNSLLDRNVYDRDYRQRVPKFMEAVLSPQDVMRYGRLAAQPQDDTAAALRRIQFDPTYDHAVSVLTLSYPSSLDYLRFLQRTGHGTDANWDDVHRLGFSPDFDAYLSEMRWTLPSGPDIARYAHITNTPFESYRDKLYRVGVHPEYHEMLDTVTRSRPSAGEWFAYKHRAGVTSMTEHEALTRLGYDPEYWPVYETLSHPYPGVADLITMAVREVFSPEIAEAFGQFREIPDAYIEACHGIGLSDEWAKNYWAAHWTLPSIQQGFDMLHRGHIDHDALARLFVALDVMPYWRDPLQNISYRVLTRVDVRRMYREGVLTYGDVNDAYRHLGYNERDAVRMSDFTVAYVRRQEVGFTRSQVLEAYRERQVDHSEALAMLADLGLDTEDGEFLLDLEDYQLGKGLTDDAVKIVGDSYKKGLTAFDEASMQLDELNVRPERKTLLLARWEVTRAAKQRTFTKSEIMRYYVNGSIGFQFARDELGRIGYAPDRVEVMLSETALRDKPKRGKRTQLTTEALTSMLATGVLTLDVLKAMLIDYGWRDPELCLTIHHIANAASLTVPDDIGPCDPQTILKML